MFVQIIQGRTPDPTGLKEQWQRWDRELKPGAKGFLGGTAGITDDGEFFAVARFESEEAARSNSDSEQQTAWWNETSKYFDGEPTFVDSTDVQEFLGGGSDEAGFVQAIQARVTNRERAAQLDKEFESELPNARPDLIGGISVYHPDGMMTSVNYFTSEEEARKGESQPMPEDQKAKFEEWMSLYENTRYIDLKDPWLTSP